MELPLITTELRTIGILAWQRLVSFLQKASTVILAASLSHLLSPGGRSTIGQASWRVSAVWTRGRLMGMTGE